MNEDATLHCVDCGDGMRINDDRTGYCHLNGFHACQTSVRIPTGQPHAVADEIKRLTEEWLVPFPASPPLPERNATYADFSRTEEYGWVDMAEDETATATEANLLDEIERLRGLVRDAHVLGLRQGATRAHCTVEECGWTAALQPGPMPVSLRALGEQHVAELLNGGAK